MSPSGISSAQVRNTFSDTLTRLPQVAGAIFFRYPLLWEKQKPAVHTAFVNMLCSLYPKGEAFTSFLNNIGEPPPIRAVSRFEVSLTFAEPCPQLLLGTRSTVSLYAPKSQRQDSRLFQAESPELRRGERLLAFQRYSKTKNWILRGFSILRSVCRPWFVIPLINETPGAMVERFGSEAARPERRSLQPANDLS